MATNSVGSQVREPDLKDFEQGAIIVRAQGGAVKRVTSADGKRLLWSPPSEALPTADNAGDIGNDGYDASVHTPQDPISTPGKSPHNGNAISTPDDNRIPNRAGRGYLVSAQLVAAIEQARTSGKGAGKVGLALGVSKSTVQKYWRLTAETDSPQIPQIPQVPQLPGIKGEFSDVKNTELPYSVRLAIQLLLDTAGHQAILGDGTTKSFFEGYLSGAQSALGVVCGALGVSLDFLQEQDGTVAGKTEKKG